jgi:hypothetical protein
MAECKSSRADDFLISSNFPPDIIRIKSMIADVMEAIVSIGRISSSPRLILNAVGTVDQNRIASPAYR